MRGSGGLNNRIPPCRGGHFPRRRGLFPISRLSAVATSPLTILEEKPTRSDHLGRDQAPSSHHLRAAV